MVYIVGAGPGDRKLITLKGFEILKNADVVIYDCPPALALADAAVLSNRVDGVVLVIDAGHTRREAARRAIANLQQAGANLLGGVLNRVPRKREEYSYYRYYSAVARGPGGKPTPGRRRRLWRWLSFFK